MNDDFLVNPSTIQKLVHGNGPIIVVDDDEDQNFIVKRFYQKSNKSNPIIFFNNGDAFIQHMLIVERDEEVVPELVLLDINMPGTDGYEVLEQIRSKGKFQKVPVLIMLTTSSSQDAIDKSKTLGANGFWTKPMDALQYVEFFNRV